MVEEAENEGGLEHHESELIRAAIEFNDMEVEDILTPRVDIVAAPDTITMEEFAVPLGLKLLNHLIVLIPNFAHQFLQNILHRHDSHGAAVFIHNHCHVGFP